MGYMELIQQRLQTLPPEKQAEVYDFVEFIATRKNAMGAAAWIDREFMQLSLDSAMRGMEDDPVHYTTDDLAERWQ